MLQTLTTDLKNRRVVTETRRSSYYYCNLSVGITLNVRFTTNGMRAKNNITYICGANKQ